MADTKTTTPAQPAKAPGAAANASASASQSDGLPEKGSMRFLVAVYGRIVHPYKVPLEFDTEKAVKAEIDDWILIQMAAGKIRAAD